MSVEILKPLSSHYVVNKTRPTEKATARNAVSEAAYKPLETEFSYGGFNYRQIAREGDVAIYEQRWPESENVSYEVVRILRQEATTFPNGKWYPARETYPPSETWGEHGFTLTDKDAAFAKLREVK